MTCSAIHSKETLSDRDFKKLSEFIYLNYGIKMPDTKKTLLEGRLSKRLRANNIKSFSAYCEFVFSEQGMAQELIHMIDVVSTNKTDFFREAAHFEFLYDYILPEFAADGKNINIWSSACSSGEEPYTTAIVLSEFNRVAPTQVPFSIFGTDISSDILNKAALAVYKDERITNIPTEYKRRYFMSNKDPQKKLIRVVPELRKACSFSRMNLIDKAYPITKRFDLIFCRNVLIYFDRPTQEAVINKLCDHLSPNGYFFLGHSESAMGMNVPLEAIKPSVFRKK